MVPLILGGRGTNQRNPLSRGIQRQGARKGWKEHSTEVGEGPRSSGERKALRERDVRSRKKRSRGSQWLPASTETCAKLEKAPLVG